MIARRSSCMKTMLFPYFSSVTFRRGTLFDYWTITEDNDLAVCSGAWDFAKTDCGPTHKACSRVRISWVWSHRRHKFKLFNTRFAEMGVAFQQCKFFFNFNSNFFSIISEKEVKIFFLKTFFEKLNYFFFEKAKLVTLCHHLGKAPIILIIFD